MFRKKKVPPMWYTQGPACRGVRPEREGPFSRAAVLELWLRGSLDGDVLVWTNEKLFPNPANVRSSRLVHIDEWRRWVELPDPTRRQLEAEARKLHREKAPADGKTIAVFSKEYDAASDPYSVENFVSGGSSQTFPPKISHGNISDGAGFGGSGSAPYGPY